MPPDRLTKTGMTDARPPADAAVQHLDRLAAVILDDVGDGPTPAIFAEIASDVHGAVGSVGVPAFSELTGLVVGIADSLGDGSTDWSPSLGGTLMAALDDLRTLVLRSAQFSSEDSEHLHQRAAALAVYAHAARRGPATPEPLLPPAAPPSPPGPASAPDSPAASLVSSGSTPPAVAKEQTSLSLPRAEQGGKPTIPAIPAASSTPLGVLSISELFYAEGPQVISGGVPASAAPRSDLLGAGIDALDSLTVQPLAMPSFTGPMTVVPVDMLTYRGRAALERAAAIREQIKTSGGNASPAALDEMYDLIGLALKD